MATTAAMGEESSAAVAMQGSKLEDFELLQQVGSGTFCVVRLCRYKKNGRVFVVKILRKKKICYLKQVVHVTQEVEILRTIEHPFIVKLYCTFQDPDNLFMVLEFACGGELFSHMRHAGHLSDEATRFYISELVLVLQYLHSRRVAYRDLKPENILIDRQGHVKVTDFGFAKIIKDGTSTMCGTPEYLAPEIIRGEPYDERVDWWALGILMYEMLVGYPPFFDDVHDNPLNIYTKILAGKIKFPVHIDQYAKDLIKRLLIPNPNERLGDLSGGAEDVKRHRFFRGVDWDQLLQRVAPPPSACVVPRSSSPTDTSYFEVEPVEADEPEVERQAVPEGVFKVFG